MKFNILTGEMLVNKTIDLQRDDSASDFTVDAHGNGIIVGRNDYIQVDSHSVVDFGQAFILNIDSNGETKNYVTFKGPRNTGISSVSLLKDTGEIYFTGIFDGPITHTGDQDPSLRFQKAMIGHILF